MSAKFGRCDTGADPMAAPHGQTIQFSGWLVGSSLNDLKARWQQLSGLRDNEDEPVVPCTFTHDSTFDGFYRVRDVNVEPVQGATYNGAFRARYTITVERAGGYANPVFEVTTQSVVRTNAFAVATPATVIGYALVGATGEVDLRPSLTSSTALTRLTEDGGSTNPLTAYTLTGPTTLTQYRYVSLPSLFYVGACRVEIKYGSTWYPVIGRNIPNSNVWRISNGYTRLTSADGSTAGTFEIWDNTAGAWEAQSIKHFLDGASLCGIGYGTGSTQAYMSILRNSPEQVVVKCGGPNLDLTYSIQRGAGLATCSYTSSPAQKLGIGFSTTNACTAVGSWGIRRTSNDSNGNRLVFGMPVAITTDVTNGFLNPSTAATSGTMFVGVELAGSGAASGNAAVDLGNQFFGAVSWRQQVIRR